MCICTCIACDKCIGSCLCMFVCEYRCTHVFPLGVSRRTTSAVILHFVHYLTKGILLFSSLSDLRTPRDSPVFTTHLGLQTHTTLCVSTWVLGIQNSSCFYHKNFYSLCHFSSLPDFYKINIYYVDCEAK